VPAGAALCRRGGWVGCRLLAACVLAGWCSIVGTLRLTWKRRLALLCPGLGIVGIGRKPLQLEALGASCRKLAIPMQYPLLAGALSRGDASIFMRFPPVAYREKIWDHCAGSIVVEEAGGKISDATGGKREG
jgi:hypothetical protein